MNSRIRKEVLNGVPQKTPEGLAICYSSRYNKCGKERCSCSKDGTKHGPYWYAYFRRGNRVISCYIGSRLTPALARKRLDAKIESLKPLSQV